ncbi:heme ABC exporter ATP-binding protein CcmA [Sphingosinicella soli]|uniref:Heme exporter protein A n=1 Tax=Sphingosinicella soli TaxID=333708 RepID=A0A7W7B3M4_9SPHN|nr:heme ABC exporter ATP-binding protein CcmA [Sphingosinicella soli]MBB4632445.1 heme exporter protein A [Sphingosinicella soli]
MGDTLIRAENLACVRGGRLLFEGLSLAVGSGEALRVTGPNGRGKSSLLRCLAGLLAPAAGRIEQSANIAWLGHENALKPSRTLAQELGWWARLDGTGPVYALGLETLGDVPVRMLSAGQKRRAALARVIASGAALWLLDEPGAGLDAANAEALSAAIGAHLAAGGGAIVVTHGETNVPRARELAL